MLTILIILTIVVCLIDCSGFLLTQRAKDLLYGEHEQKEDWNATVSREEIISKKLKRKDTERDTVPPKETSPTPEPNQQYNENNDFNYDFGCLEDELNGNPEHDADYLTELIAANDYKTQRYE